MKTLLCSHKTPLHFFSNPSPLNEKTLLLHRKSVSNPKNSKRKPWKVNANAKGFGTVKDNNNVPTKKISEKTNNNGRGSNDDDDQLPDVVLERIIVRILVSVGAPLASGLAILHFLGVAKEQHLLDVPFWVPLVTTFVTFGMSAVGIAYGSLSTSWDAEKKGSLLGFEEAKQNWGEMWKEENDIY